MLDPLGWFASQSLVYQPSKTGRLLLRYLSYDRCVCNLSSHTVFRLTYGESWVDQKHTVPCLQRPWMRSKAPDRLPDSEGSNLDWYYALILLALAADVLGRHVKPSITRLNCREDIWVLRPIFKIISRAYILTHNARLERFQSEYKVISFDAKVKSLQWTTFYVFI